MRKHWPESAICFKSRQSMVWMWVIGCMAPFGDGFKFRVYEISLRRREPVVKWLLMGDGEGVP
ncbi:hypothetical protein F220043C3_42620 [Enterocloster asparagiformis]